MIQKMYSVRDSKAQAFLQPFFSSADGAALRALSDAVTDGKSQLSHHPEDYILYAVGSFDDNSGEIIPLNPIKLLAVASDFVEISKVKPTTIPEMREAFAVENGKK